MKMSQSSSDASKSGSQIELIQNLFGEILQIQKENKTPDEAITRIQEIILESSRVVENSTSPNEMLVDAKILQTGSSYVSTNVTSLNTNLTAFNESKYVRGVLSYVENSNQVLQCGKEWMALSPITYKMFKKTHPVSFLLGTLAFEPPPPKEKTKPERKQTKKGMEAEKKVLSSEAKEKEQAEEGSDIYDHIFRWLVKHYKKNGKNPICYFSFILDPGSYWRTIKNIFHFAFLVRDGNVKMDISNGLPTIEPLLKKSEEETTGEKLPSNQFCFTLSVKDWEDSIERFQIRSPSIPPFLNQT